jgi:hypothetical protein
MNLLLRARLLACFLTLLLASCEEKVVEKKPDDATLKNCRKQVTRLENYLLDAHMSASRLEELVYKLTQSYIIVDEKLRLIQKYQSDPTKKEFLNRTASDINRFFAQSAALIDSAESDIKKSGIASNSLIPILESVREYLHHQERLFVDVYGNIGAIQQHVSKLEESMKAKEVEFNNKEMDSRQKLDQQEREKRKVRYLIGNRSELDRSKAVKKTGGILGIGGTLRLSDKLDESFFQSGDYVVLKEISLGNTQKVNLITTHPKGSYLVMETPGEKFLKVTNPEKFWSASRYLVVEVD